MTMQKVINEHQRRRITGVPRSTWYRWEREGLVPQRIQLGPRRVGWLLNEINAWIDRCERVKATPAP